MWKRAAPAAAIAALLMAFASPAMANTSTSVKLSFTEPIIQNLRSGCPALDLPDGGFCGTGVVVPYGNATETIAFSAGCSGGCDLRAVYVAGGTLLDETFSNGQCPGSCHPNRAAPGSGSLTDVIISGTGMFAGASGVLTGAVTAAGLQSHVELSGTVTLAS